MKDMTTQHEKASRFDTQAVDDSVLADWNVRLNARTAAEAAWRDIQQNPVALLGQKAIAAIALQEAQISVAAYERFHDLPTSQQLVDK